VLDQFSNEILHADCPAIKEREDIAVLCRRKEFMMVVVGSRGCFGLFGVSEYLIYVT